MAYPSIDTILHQEVDTEQLLRAMGTRVSVRSLAALARILREVALYHNYTPMSCAVARYAAFSLPIFFSTQDRALGKVCEECMESRDMQRMFAAVFEWLMKGAGEFRLERLLLGACPGASMRQCRGVGLMLVDSIMMAHRPECRRLCVLVQSVPLTRSPAWMKELATHLHSRMVSIRSQTSTS